MGTTRRPSSCGGQAGIEVPSCFIVVCNNTSMSKLVYDFVSGFLRENENGSTTLVNGRLLLFLNFDEHGNALARPHTLLIDREQLDSGKALDKHFRAAAAAAADGVERFRREVIIRTVDRRQAEHLSDQDRSQGVPRRRSEKQRDDAEATSNCDPKTGYEAEQPVMVGTPRALMDAADDKHVVIVLKHISDAVEERQASVLAQWGRTPLRTATSTLVSTSPGCRRRPAGRFSRCERTNRSQD